MHTVINLDIAIQPPLKLAQFIIFEPTLKILEIKLVKAPISDSVGLEVSVGNGKPEAPLGRDNMAIAEVAISDISKDDLNNPVTPLARTGMTLLEARRRKRNIQKSKKATESQISSTEDGETVTTSNRRKRKTWSSLKEIAESSIILIVGI